VTDTIPVPIPGIPLRTRLAVTFDGEPTQVEIYISHDALRALILRAHKNRGKSARLGSVAVHLRSGRQGRQRSLK